MLICFLDVRDKMGDPGVVKAGINAAPITALNASSSKCIQSMNAVLRSVQTRLWGPLSYPVGTGGNFPRR
jgi:hypothetical protein